MTATVVTSHSAPRGATRAWDTETSAWRRLGRVVWLQHRPACLGFLALFAVLAAAIVIEASRAHGAYAAFVSAGCVPTHLRTTTACNNDALALTDGAEFRAIGMALVVLPLLVGVFLGAPLVSREVESGTFRFAWTQGCSRSRLVLFTLGVLALGLAVAGLLLGLLYGGWYAHAYEVVLAPGNDQWQPVLFATTWWLLPLWMVLGLAVGTLTGVGIRRVVPAMAATTAVVGALIAGMYLLLPRLLGIGADVRRLRAPIGTMALGTIHTPDQLGWPFPLGSWVVRGWPAGAGRSLFVSYQPPGHFWAAQAVEGAAVLVVVALCAALTLRLVGRRAGA